MRYLHKYILLSVYCLLLSLNCTAQIINTICGDGTSGYSGDGGPATAARLHVPVGLAFDAAGNLYIADGENSVVRKINTVGIISTIAGRDSSGYGIWGDSGDGGQATDAELDVPYGLCLDAAGNLYIAENLGFRVRKVILSTGIISTVAGSGTHGFGGDGGPATAAKLSIAYDVKCDAAGNIYIADLENNRIRKIDASTGIITTICGTGAYGYSGDGGPATAAELDEPSALAFDAAGNLYIGDDSGKLRMINSNGIISTVAGGGNCGGLYCGDGGPATAADISVVAGIVLDAAGNLYFTDINNGRVRMVDNTGIISSIAGDGTGTYSGDGGAATAAGIGGEWGITLDGAGNLYISAADRIRMISNVGQMGINQLAVNSEQ